MKTKFIKLLLTTTFMEYKQIREGKIRLMVPKEEKISKKMRVFYNPKMEFSRNISVCSIQAFLMNFPKNKVKICDALSATGVSGLRYAKEVSGAHLILNDKNPIAVKLIKDNIKLNRLKNCKVENKDANILLSENIFTVVDIDPFGTPVRFLDSCARSVFWKGFLCVTATDTAPLCGTYPEACLRKYGIKSIKTDYYNELGIRILISSIILNCARYEKAFVPRLSFSYAHCFRVFGKISRGARKVDKILNQFDFVMHCNRCGNRKAGDLELKCRCGEEFEVCGPIYLGEINHKKFIIETKKEAEKRNFSKEALFLTLLCEELQVPFYYDLHYLAKTVKTKIPKIDELIAKLKKIGFKASRTHFCPTGVKTNAEFNELKNMLLY